MQALYHEQRKFGIATIGAAVVSIGFLGPVNYDIEILEIFVTPYPVAPPVGTVATVQFTVNGNPFSMLYELFPLASGGMQSVNDPGLAVLNAGSALAMNASYNGGGTAPFAWQVRFRQRIAGSDPCTTEDTSIRRSFL